MSDDPREPQSLAEAEEALLSLAGSLLSRPLKEIQTAPLTEDRYRTLLEQVLPNNSRVSEFKVDHEFPTIGRRTMLLDARRLHPEGRGTQSILLSIYDMTEKDGANKS